MSTTLEKRTDAAPAAQTQAWRRPRYDVVENDDAFVVSVSLPGVRREGVNISLEDDALSITGTRTADLPKGWRPLRRELPEGDYRLNLRLNVEVKEDAISATAENGILTLTLPKREKAVPRQIAVR